jgi:hypothetical protein
VRYQKQYVDRAISIFGLDSCKAQIAYAGLFKNPAKPTPSLVEQVEKNIQRIFLDRVGKSNATFTLEKGEVTPLKILHTGVPPKFLTMSPNSPNISDCVCM